MFEKIISLSNLFYAWKEFKRGKLKKQDVRNFSTDIEQHVFELHNDLKKSTYNHSTYTSFFICDPKRRNIHKAIVRDRLMHHAIFRIIEPIFDKTFIFDSFSSRKGKGTHRAHDRFTYFAWKQSKNNTKPVWVLKCDICKFFDSVDHKILLNLLRRKVGGKTLNLLENIISSFETKPGKGIPIGNLTSQLFSNIYLNELDQFIKRELKIKYYIRYADDFVIISRDKNTLTDLVSILNDFLQKKLALEMHPNKIIIRKWGQGIDFLGFVIFPLYKILRTKIKIRILKKLDVRKKEFDAGLISDYSLTQSVSSYVGILNHCRGREIKKKIGNIFGNSCSF